MGGWGSVGAEGCGGSQTEHTEGTSNWDFSLLFSFPFEMGQDGSELVVLLPPTPKCWDSGQVIAPGNTCFMLCYR